MQEFGEFFKELMLDIAGTNQEIALFVLIAIAGIIVLDALMVYTRKEKQKAGIVPKRQKKIIGASVTSLQAKKYVSDMQGIAGTPDALIVENGYIIPVERKPMARKLRDRYVAQLLVYMRLVEEFEGKRPPYGYLVLGKNCRRVKIENSAKRQAWLQEILDDMREVLKGISAAEAAPHPAKCRRCSVRIHCSQFVSEFEQVRPGKQTRASLEIKYS